MKKEKKDAASGQEVNGTIASEAERKRIFKKTVAMLQAPVETLDNIPITTDHYVIISNGQSIHLGTVQNMIDQECFRQILKDATGVTIPLFNDEEWAIIVSAMLEAAELIDGREGE